MNHEQRLHVAGFSTCAKELPPQKHFLEEKAPKGGEENKVFCETVKIAIAFLKHLKEKLLHILIFY